MAKPRSTEVVHLSAAGKKKFSGTRMSAKNIPSKPTACDKTCVYSVKGECDNPWLNRGNGDAYCHRITVRKVVAWLKPEEWDL